MTTMLQEISRIGTPPLDVIADEAPVGTVVIVSSDVQTGWYLDMVLRGIGYRTLLAETGDDALEFSAKEEVDLLFCDTHIPSGFVRYGSDLESHRDYNGKNLITAFGDIPTALFDTQTPKVTDRANAIVLDNPLDAAEIREVVQTLKGEILYH